MSYELEVHCMLDNILTDLHKFESKLFDFKKYDLEKLKFCIKIFNYGNAIYSNNK